MRCAARVRVHIYYQMRHNIKILYSFVQSQKQEVAEQNASTWGEECRLRCTPQGDHLALQAPPYP